MDNVHVGMSVTAQYGISALESSEPEGVVNLPISYQIMTRRL